MTSSTITSRADVTTDKPDRYAKQLVSHLGRRIDFVTDGATSTATIGDAVGQVVVGDGVLTLLAVGNDDEAVTVVAQVLSSHLERFGSREQLSVTWTRTTAPADTAQAPAAPGGTSTTSDPPDLHGRQHP